MTPTVLLVHGAFSETTVWSGIVRALRRRAIDAIALPTPLTGLRADAAYVAARARGVGGPVLLAGEGYGGAVITVAGDACPQATGLVYVAAYAPDVGESCVALDRGGVESLHPEVVPRTHGATGVEASIRRERYREVAAADLASDEALTAAVTQRPVFAEALDEPASAAAWGRLPSWFVVATADRLVSPGAQRFMARRAGGEVTELHASHAVCRSRADEVAAVIARAAGHTAA